MPLCSIALFWPKIAGSFCDADHENASPRLGAPSIGGPGTSSGSLAIIRRDLPSSRPHLDFSVPSVTSLRCGYDLFFTGVSWHKHESGMCAMHDEVITQTKADREILSFDVSDELLERAANTEQSAFTLSFCTSIWDSCGMPQWRN